jgi:hypothetical protein
LTGTPIFDNPMNAFVFFSVIRPDICPPYSEFLSRYSVINYGKNRPELLNLKNIEEFKFILSKILIRRMGKDVLAEMPPKVRQFIEVDIG